MRAGMRAVPSWQADGKHVFAPFAFAVGGSKDGVFSPFAVALGGSKDGA